MHRFVVLSAILFLTGLLCTEPAIQQKTVIPFTLTAQNNVVVRVKINGADTLQLMLHTASSDVRLTEEAVRKSKTIRFSASEKVQAWGGEADSRMSKGNRIQIGNLQRSNILIWEDKNSGKDTDGKFGLDFFQNQIVEIDFDQRHIVVYDNLPRKAEEYQRLKVDNNDGQLMVEGSCQLEGKKYANKFLLHSGYSGGILLDDAFVANAGIDGKIKILEESSLQDSFGNTIKVKKGIVPEFFLGNSLLSEVPAGFFAGSIGRQKMSVMGCEVIRRFNLIFDIARNDLYLQPRQA